MAQCIESIFHRHAGRAQGNRSAAAPAGQGSPGRPAAAKDGGSLEPEEREARPAEIPLARANAVREVLRDGRRHVIKPILSDVDERFETVGWIAEDVWHAACPFCGNVAKEISLTDRRFICIREHCTMGGANGARGRPIRLVLPPPETIIRIELALELRPDMRTRWWKAPETVPDLIAENAKHGLAQLEEPLWWAWRASRQRWVLVFGEDVVARVEAELPAAWVRP